MSYAYGGYMTSWNDARYFKPHDDEKVIIHWDGFIDVARYRKSEDAYELCEDLFVAPKVDYWMRIPPVPEREE